MPPPTWPPRHWFPRPDPSPSCPDPSVRTRHGGLPMTIDWNVDTPTPRRPAPARLRAARPRGRVPRGAATILGLALVLALMLASCGLLDDLDADGARATRHAVRPVTAHATVRPLRIRWG